MTAGVAVVEAVVALLLTAVALGTLTAGAAAGVRHVHLARQRGTALALAANRLDALSAGPRAAGTGEVVIAGTRYELAWHTRGGRGAVARLEVEVTWPDGHVALEGGAFP